MPKQNLRATTLCQTTWWSAPVLFFGTSSEFFLRGSGRRTLVRLSSLLEKNSQAAPNRETSADSAVANPVYNLLVAGATFFGLLITTYSFTHAAASFTASASVFATLFLSFVAATFLQNFPVTTKLSTVSTGPIINTAISLNKLTSKEPWR